MTLPDRILAHLAENDGLISDNEGRVEALLASRLGERNVPAVKTALSVLREKGLVRCTSKLVELHEHNGRTTIKGRPLQAPQRITTATVAGATLEPIDPELVERLPRTGRKSWGSQVVEAFLDSGEAAVRVVGFEGKAGFRRTSIDTYLRKRGLTNAVLVKVADNAIYLSRRDVKELKVVGGGVGERD